MVQVKPLYKYSKTAKKTFLNLAIWIIPQILAFVLFSWPQLNEMSVAALVSLIANQVVDWLKHKNG